MLIETLTNIGLRENEAKVYVALLGTGTTHASRLVHETGLAKSSVYNALEYLSDRGLVFSFNNKGTKKFSPESPSRLDSILKREEKEAQNRTDQLKGILTDLHKLQNPHLILPQVRMYTGEEGMAHVFDDTLTSSETIYTYVSVEQMETHMKHINDPYVEKRVKLGIKKQALVEDSEWTRRFLKDYDGMEVSEVRFLPKESQPFSLEMNIYDRKVSYITYRDKEPIGVIIEDQDIYDVHRSMFEVTWNYANP